jgi:hypothetical protein
MPNLSSLASLSWSTALRRSCAVVAALCALACALACGGGNADGTADGRQPIPAGVNPKMVEYRSDGVLIPSRDSLLKTPGYVVDSLFTPEEDLRRFRATVAGPAPTRLAGGERSTDELLRRYWTLLTLRDTLAMTPLVVSRGEYAYLYFPFSREAAAGLPPAAGWELILAQSGRGLTRALQQAAREPAAVLGTLCSDQPLIVGGGRLYGPCGVIVRRSRGVDTLWLAKSLLVRDGVHKFLGLQNELGGN